MKALSPRHDHLLLHDAGVAHVNRAVGNVLKKSENRNEKVISSYSEVLRE